MPIRPFLAGQAFDPETITKMSAGFESVCVALSLKLVDDAATRLVAQKIIELAQRGEDADTSLFVGILGLAKRSTVTNEIRRNTKAFARCTMSALQWDDATCPKH